MLVLPPRVRLLPPVLTCAYRVTAYFVLWFLVKVSQSIFLFLSSRSVTTYDVAASAHAPKYCVASLLRHIHTCNRTSRYMRTRPQSTTYMCLLRYICTSAALTCVCCVISAPTASRCIRTV
ncbi:hypothetical protein R3P38DRAFT_2907649 [Favolaschia claudopus]|uniref:Secreted protein n=1 Tax=Favolaschia claudopus TaxID=2862362 RepID=A0AAW0CDL4_9AGAR